MQENHRQEIIYLLFSDAKKAGYEQIVDLFKKTTEINRYYCGAIGFSSILLVIFNHSVLVRVKLGSPVLFKQERLGRIDKRTGKERIFCLYKFRTMTDQRDEKGDLLPDEVRLTPFGLWLRRTSLDEIPEMFNILKGDISLIGPCPLLV